MAYPQPENLGTQGERRVVGILTVTNLVGGLAGLGALWLIAGLLGIGGGAQLLSAGGLLRAALALMGGVLGVVATFRWTGISLWDRALLWLGFQVRRTAGRTTLTPPPAARLTHTQTRAPLLRGGKVIAEVYDPAAEAALVEVRDV